MIGLASRRSAIHPFLRRPSALGGVDPSKAPRGDSPEGRHFPASSSIHLEPCVASDMSSMLGRDIFPTAFQAPSVCLKWLNSQHAHHSPAVTR